MPAVRTRPTAPQRLARVPIVTLVLIVVISTVSAIGYGHPGVFEALERQRGAVADGQVWRLVTPLVVQTDGWKALLAVVWLLLLVGLVAEPLFGHGRFLALFLLAGVVGHSVGIVWQPGAGGARWARSARRGRWPRCCCGRRAWAGTPRPGGSARWAACSAAPRW